MFRFGFSGILYQSVKFFVLVIDMGMLYWLQKMVVYFVVIKLRLLERSLFIHQLRRIESRYQLFLIVIHLILVLNLIWIILRCFIGSISDLYNHGGVDMFDIIRQCRYTIQSVFEFINGTAILISLYYIAQGSRKRRSDVLKMKAMLRRGSMGFNSMLEDKPTVVKKRKFTTAINDPNLLTEQ